MPPKAKKAKTSPAVLAIEPADPCDPTASGVDANGAGEVATIENGAPTKGKKEKIASNQMIRHTMLYLHRLGHDYNVSKLCCCKRNR